MIETIAAVMKSTGERAGFYEAGKVTNRGEWLAQPYSFDQAAKAVAAILEHHRPPGKVVVPKPSLIQIGGDPKKTAARKDVWSISSEIVKTYNVTQSAIGDKNGRWTTVVAGAILIP